MGYPAWRTPYRRTMEPLAELAALRREMGRMLAALSGLRGDAASLGDIEMDQDEQGWTVIARLPGVAPDEVQIEVEDRELCIQVLGASGDGDDEGRAARRVDFDYRVVIPGEVDQDKIEATMDHGLLTVHLPRSARSARRTISVGRGSGRGPAAEPTAGGEGTAGSPAEQPGRGAA